VLIPESVTKLGRNAFAHGGLEDLTFAPQSKLGTIASFAFAGNSLGDVTLSKNLQLIGEGAFENAGLTSVSFVVGNKIQTIGPRAFAANSKLDTINIPMGVSLGMDAFAGSACADPSIFVAGNTIIHCVVVAGPTVPTPVHPIAHPSRPPSAGPVVAPCVGQNLARNRSVEASDDSRNPQAAVDGDPGTEWRFKGRSYMVVDLVTVAPIDEVTVAWGSRFPRGFVITFYDSAAKMWRDAFRETDGVGGDQIFPVSFSARYVMLGVESLNSSYGLLKEIEIRRCTL